MTDCYTKLRMEFAVLQELLKDGIFKERINGILAVLKEAIDNKDGQLILYCLENILNGMLTISSPLQKIILCIVRATI